MGGDTERIVVYPIAAPTPMPPRSPTDGTIVKKRSSSVVQRVSAAMRKVSNMVAEAAASMLDVFRTFDAEEAECFKPEDREHLLGIIEMGFGDFAHFNEMVRTVFTAALEDKIQPAALADPDADDVEAGALVTSSPRLETIESGVLPAVDAPAAAPAEAAAVSC